VATKCKLHHHEPDQQPYSCRYYFFEFGGSCATVDALGKAFDARSLVKCNFEFTQKIASIRIAMPSRCVTHT